jgi:hypothetical protein
MYIYIYIYIYIYFYLCADVVSRFTMSNNKSTAKS